MGAVQQLKKAFAYKPVIGSKCAGGCAHMRGGVNNKSGGGLPVGTSGLCVVLPKCKEAMTSGFEMTSTT